MEYEYSTSANPETPQQLVVDDAAKAYLLETARWGRFLGIIGIIGLVFLIIFALFFIVMGSTAMSMGTYNTAASGMGAAFGGIMGFLYLVIAALYAYPVLKLLKFSNVVKSAIHTNNQFDFTQALGHQKSMYKFMGIFTIIMLIMYGIGILFMLVIGVTAGMS